MFDVVEAVVDASTRAKSKGKTKRKPKGEKGGSLTAITNGKESGRGKIADSHARLKLFSVWAPGKGLYKHSRQSNAWHSQTGTNCPKPLRFSFHSARSRSGKQSSYEKDLSSWKSAFEPFTPRFSSNFPCFWCGTLLVASPKHDGE